MKVACTVRRGEVGKVSKDNSPAPYPTSETRRSEKVIKTGRGIAVVRATVKDGKGGIATGTKMEKCASFPDWLEKAETGAIGRALAALGYGTQFAPELNEEHRIVDAPVDRSVSIVNGTSNTPAANSNGRKSLTAVRPLTSSNNSAPAPEVSPDAPATEQQRASIRKLSEHLGKAEPENPDTLSYGDAKELITQLSQEYRQSRKAS